MRLRTHPFTLRQLQYVVAVAEHESFRKAATACAVSQPALSAQIAQLEGALGVRLFERDTTHVKVTAAGAALVARARDLIEDADRLADEAVRAADPLSGLLRLGVIPTVGPYLLPEVALPLREAFPKLRFSWVEDKTAQLAAQLRTSVIDGAIVALETDELGDMQSIVLGKDTFYLATSRDHPLAKGDAPIGTEVLAEEQVLILEDGHCLGHQVADVCRRARASNLDVCGTSLATLSQMVVGGAGVTLLPALARGVENRRGTLHLRPFQPEAPARTLALVWRKGSSSVEALRAIAPVIQRAVSAA